MCNVVHVVYDKFEMAIKMVYKAFCFLGIIFRIVQLYFKLNPKAGLDHHPTPQQIFLRLLGRVGG